MAGKLLRELVTEGKEYVRKGNSLDQLKDKLMKENPDLTGKDLREVLKQSRAEQVARKIPVTKPSGITKVETGLAKQESGIVPKPKGDIVPTPSTSLSNKLDSGFDSASEKKGKAFPWLKPALAATAVGTAATTRGPETEAEAPQPDKLPVVDEQEEDKKKLGLVPTITETEADKPRKQVSPNVHDKQITGLINSLDKMEIPARGALSKDWEQKFNTLKEEYKDKRKSAEWGEVAEMLAHAFTQLAAGMYGLKHNVDFNNVKFKGRDWSKKYDMMWSEYKDSQALLSQARTQEEREIAKQYQDGLTQFRVNRDNLLTKLRMLQQKRRDAQAAADKEADRELRREIAQVKAQAQADKEARQVQEKTLKEQQKASKAADKAEQKRLKAINDFYAEYEKANSDDKRKQAARKLAAIPGVDVNDVMERIDEIDAESWFSDNKEEVFKYVKELGISTEETKDPSVQKYADDYFDGDYGKAHTFLKNRGDI